MGHKGLVSLAGFVRSVLELLHLLWQTFHVTLAALDFFVENDPVETLATIDQLLGKFEVGARNEAEFVDEFLDV